MAKKITIAARLNDVLADKVKEYARINGLSYTDVIEKSLNAYFDCLTNDQVTIEVVEQELNSVEQERLILENQLLDTQKELSRLQEERYDAVIENAVLKERCESLSKQVEEKNKDIEFFKKEIEVKNEQILNAQDQGKAAQVLQAAEKQEKLPPATIEAENIQEEIKQPMTRWQHFKAIFRN